MAIGRQTRPVIELQLEGADCGYVCVSAALALQGVYRSVAEIKSLAGNTSRGLTLKQLRDVLRVAGLTCEAIFFDKRRASAFPAVGIVLLEAGHYVLVSRVRGERVETFDPQLGWAWTSRRNLARRCNGLGIEVRGLANPTTHAECSGSAALPSLLPFYRTFLARGGIWALSLFAAAQCTLLALPLLSMWSVDEVATANQLSLAGAVGLGFLAMSLANSLTTAIAELFYHKMNWQVARGFVGQAFDNLAAKRAYWFETNRASAVQHKLNSYQLCIDYASDTFRTAGALVIAIAVGLTALVYLSPWLVVPGLLSLTLSVVIELAFNRAQMSKISSALDATQRKQSFVLEVLSQIPVIARHGALAQTKAQFGAVAGRVALMETSLRSLRSWRALLSGSVKSLDTLAFATIAALFMARGEYTIGAFVALGAYKDLLATSLATLFQQRQRRKMLDVHRLQAADLLGQAPRIAKTPRTIGRGEVVVRKLRFRYGELDRDVLHGVSFSVAPGECVAIKGESGSGKSTLAKIIAGTLAPTEGEVLIDGAPPTAPMNGFAAVLQTDRLISGSIRDNVTLYRRHISDAAVRTALEQANLREFVDSLPMRLNTQVTEGTPGLSGGQRQRLLLARALVAMPRLVVLDEATSSLDVANECHILRQMLAGGCTGVIISHRPEVWNLADRVVTLESELGTAVCDSGVLRAG